MQNQQEIELISFVAAFDATSAPKLDVTNPVIRDLEARLSLALQRGDAQTSRGPAQLIVCPRDRMQMLIEEERVEIRRSFVKDSAQELPLMAELFWSAFDSMKTDQTTFPWTRFGYNFTYTIPTANIAMGTLEPLLISDTFKNRIGFPIAGAAAWTWVTLPDANLWLRIEPFRADPLARQVSVISNFEVPTQQLTSMQEIVDNLERYLNVLKDLIIRIGL